MKKILAVVLAMCMLFAMSTVAFAANPITKDTEQTGATIIKTVGQGPTDPDVPGADEDWTVTIPAELAVPWDNVNGGSASDVYTLSAHLSKGSSVTVSVSPFGDKALAMTLKGDTETIPATISGDASISTSQTTTTPVSGDITASIAAADFDAAYVGEYAGNLTFTVVYTNGIAA